MGASWRYGYNCAARRQTILFGCGPRSYRDVGFRLDSDDNGGRLAWLPHVHGPKVLADTNGQYHDEPARLLDCLFAPAAASASEQDSITPGRFEFELGRRPSVLIFSTEDPAVSRRDQQIGLFLAGLMEGSAVRAGSSVGGMRRRAYSAAYSRMIDSQTYLVSVMGTSNQTRRSLLFSLRSNQTINRALRAAYRKPSDQGTCFDKCKSWGHCGISLGAAEKLRIARAEVWRVRVLEFVLERDAFYSPFATATISYEKPVFHS